MTLFSTLETMIAPVTKIGWRRIALGAIGPFLASRLLVLVLLVLSSSWTVQTVPAREGLNYNPTIEFNAEHTVIALRRIWLSGDASWYVKIAKCGYDEGPFTQDVPRNWVFFPVYPLLIRLLSVLVHDPLISGLIISNICLLLALGLLLSLALENGIEEQQARAAVWLLAFFPASYFFSSPLTESLFLVLLLASFLALERSSYVASGLLFMLAGSTRPTGMLMLPAFVLAFVERGALKDRRAWLALAVSPLGIIIFMSYLSRLTGNPLAFVDNQVAWGRGEATVLDLLERIIRKPSDLMLPWNFVLLNSFAALLTLGAGGYFIIKRQFSWVALLLVPLLVTLNSGTLQSTARFTLVLFPLFLFLGQMTAERTIERLLLAAFSSFLGIMTVLYALHVTAAMA